CALSTLDTNGKVSGRNSSPSNCVMRLWPSVSAVTPVWSETKNAVRRLTARVSPPGWCERCTVFPPRRAPASARRRPAGASLKAYVIPFEQLTMRDVETVGGKNASLGEMIGALARLGVQVPGGFATTAHAYREFLEHGGLQARISAELTELDV